jgi:hypothetical protein
MINIAIMIRNMIDHDAENIENSDDDEGWGEGWRGR